MKLPFAEHAFIEDAKLRDYLLSSVHPIGRFKCQFFLNIGYTAEQWETLRRDLMTLAVTSEAEERERTRYGQKYVVRGRLMGPSRKSAEVATAWIVLHGEQAPRFVTAYPGSER